VRAAGTAAALCTVLVLPARAQQPPPPPADAQAAQPAPHWSGGLAAGLSEIERLADAGDPDGAARVADDLLAPDAFLRWRAARKEGFVRSALELADPVLERLGLNGPDARLRAAVQYAKGVALAGAPDAGQGEDEAQRQRLVASGEAFQRARALAGPGALRKDAIYDLGTLDLREGERQRAKIPELGGTPPAAPAPAAPGSSGAPGGPGAIAPAPGAAGGGEEAPDPLQLARKAYESALGHFVERLREDWHDADTRADVELTRRRLRELDEIERQRQQQQQQQQKQQQKQDKDQQQDQKDKDKQDQHQKQDQKQDQDQKDQQGEPKDQQQDKPSPDEKKPEEPEKPDKPQDQKEGDQDEPKPDDAKPQEGQKPDERLLTREELMRLLDRLQQLEEQGEKIRAQLRQARRAKVDKDW
jgi:flagellar biosynthesis GTPase FlhF